jgi:hypothetical protein
MFNYLSVQEYSSAKSNMPVKTVRNIVTIKNGKGTKSVEEYVFTKGEAYSRPGSSNQGEEYMNGKLKKRGTKRLSSKEIRNIKDRKFMPGLFKDCLTCKKTTRHKRSTQKKKLK